MTEYLDPITPGEILLEEFLEPLKISQNKLSRDIDVPPARINDIIHARRGITADTALRFSHYFGTTPEFWMHLQMRYDLKNTRAEKMENIIHTIRPIQNETQPHA